MANYDWKELEERFINPYNFVGLGGDVERNTPQKGELTGKINCTLTVKTPLCIPDAETKRSSPGYNSHTDENSHYIYNFYRVGGIPTIAGSQLKGMVRSYYEAITNSCLSVNNNNIMSARHSFPRLPGLLKYDKQGWHLFPAKMKKYNGFSALKENEYKRVWYSKEGRKTYWIFSPDGSEVECGNLKKAIDDYNENIEFYKANGGSFKRYKAELTYKLKADPSSNEMYPIFYEMISDNNGEMLVYFSPSQIGRSVFSKRIDDILGSHSSCARSNGACLCKACSLFGIIVKKGGRSKASSLRFSDAKAVGENLNFERNVTLKELSSPKTTSVEFYTHRPLNAVAWTYESKTTDYIKDKQGSKTYIIPERELCDVELNGRKFYLHNPNLSREDYYTYKKTKRNSTMELCKAGAQFKFSVYFENISEVQLRELVWTLTLGENSADSDLMFKLGHGKPLGLGSVKITVDGIESREFDREKLTYCVKKITPSEFLPDCPFDTSSNTYRTFMAMVNFRTAAEPLKNGIKISYPIADTMENNKNSKASHQWFTANRSVGEDGNQTAWSIKYELPKITDDDLTLPAFERSEEKQSDKSRKKRDRNNNYNNNRNNSYNYECKPKDEKKGNFFANVKEKPKRK